MFRKVYIDKKIILEQYKLNGYDGLYEMFTTPHEIIYTSDGDFCSKVVKTVLSGDGRDKNKVKLSKILIWQDV